jgi:membrane protein DedA with SNARE-associated domain
VPPYTPAPATRSISASSAAAAGAIVGDNIGFWVGREFGQPLLEKWGHLIGLDARRGMLGRFLFEPYGGSIVFFGRFVALLRAFAALLAGANGLAPWRFFVSNAAGGIVWATVFGTGGYLLGEGIRRNRGTRRLGLAVVGGRLRVRLLAVLQKTRRSPVGQGRT